MFHSVECGIAGVYCERNICESRHFVLIRYVYDFLNISYIHSKRYTEGMCMNSEICAIDCIDSIQSIHVCAITFNFY